MDGGWIVQGMLVLLAVSRITADDVADECCRCSDVMTCMSVVILTSPNTCSDV